MSKEPAITIGGSFFADLAELTDAINRLARALEATRAPAVAPDTRTNPPLTDIEVAVRLGVSRFTVRAWRGKGLGPRYIKVGRAIRYRVADVERYELESRQRTFSHPND